MPPKKRAKTTKTKGKKGAASSPSALTKASNNNNNNGLPPPAGQLIRCDAPTKQYILHLNEQPGTKKFVLEDLDAHHLLVASSAKAEIDRKVQRWMDEVCFFCVCMEYLVGVYTYTLCFVWIFHLTNNLCFPSCCPGKKMIHIFSLRTIHQNVFSAVERVGESLDMS